MRTIETRAATHRDPPASHVPGGRQDLPTGSPHSRRSGGSILRLLAIASYFAASSSSALEMSSSVTREAMRL